MTKFVWKHGRLQNSFLGWANHILDWEKRYLNTFHSQFLIQISYFVPNISQMSNSWTGQLPIGANPHCWKLNIFKKLFKLFYWIRSTRASPPEKWQEIQHCKHWQLSIQDKNSNTHSHAANNWQILRCTNKIILFTREKNWK